MSELTSEWSSNHQVELKDFCSKWQNLNESIQTNVFTNEIKKDSDYNYENQYDTYELH